MRLQAIDNALDKLRILQPLLPVGASGNLQKSLTIDSTRKV